MALLSRHPGPLLAEINPENKISIAFFESLGFTCLQLTYSFTGLPKEKA